ncbi:MAG TPA: hypothetical protein VLJ58_12860 [Ramlibacter sp.]|nr:hypothetical protein [Ramlibacter sp.]
MSYRFSRLAAAVAAAGAGLFMAATVCAQVQFPVPPPTPKVGEITKYRTVDLWNNSELGRSQNELVEVDKDGFVTRFTSTTVTQPRTARFTSEWQPCRSLQNSNSSVCAGSFKFPMQVGNKHSYEKQPWPNGQGHSSGECEVKGTEKLTVPAGSFDTVVIECKGHWNQVFGDAISGRQTETYWYAPALARPVRSEYFNFDPRGKPFTKNRTELVEFIHAK